MPFAGRGLGTSRQVMVTDGRTTASHAAVTFVLSAVYVTTTVSLVQFAVRLLPWLDAPVSTELVTVVLLLGGLLVLGAVRAPGIRPLSTVGLVRRPSAGRETGLGAAIGWAVGVLLVLPGLLTLHLHASLLLDGFHLGAAAASTLLLALFVLGRQLVLCGLPFRSLSQATSPLFASVAFSGVAAVLTLTVGHGDSAQALMAAMVQMVLSTAAARTRGIWLGTGLHFFWLWSITVLFGLPSFLAPPILGVVQGSMSGPRWLTGDGFGPEAAIWAGVAALGALVAVWRLTRDYAWHYTFDPIVGAGYPMDVAPPAEHTRMEEQTAARPTPLVQIGGIAPNQPGEGERDA